MTTGETQDREPTHLPSFCDACLYEIVHGAGLGEQDPWRSAVVIVQVGLFNVAMRDERVYGRCSVDGEGLRDLADLSLVLAEIGCLGCFKPKTREWLTEELVSRGLRDVANRARTEEIQDRDVEVSA